MTGVGVAKQVRRERRVEPAKEPAEPLPMERVVVAQARDVMVLAQPGNERLDSIVGFLGPRREVLDERRRRHLEPPLVHKA